LQTYKLSGALSPHTFFIADTNTQQRKRVTPSLGASRVGSRALCSLPATTSEVRTAASEPCKPEGPLQVVVRVC
jgi:hypothetical protein